MKIRVYWADCDSAGIVYYGNFFRFFEMAEEDLYIAQGWSRSDVYRDLKVGFPRLETFCRFFKPARLGDMIEVTTWITKRTQKSMQFWFEIRREGEEDLVAEGNYTVVCINRQFQPIPLPPEVIRLLGDYLPPVSERAAPVAETKGGSAQ